jgi:pimeloyl-ACP methyl ester carboxylesterase
VGKLKPGRIALSAALTLCLSCAANGGTRADDLARRDAGASADAGPIDAQAGLLELSPRNVVIHGHAVSLAATSKIFYNFRPADTDAEHKPLIVLFNGFASDVVRAFGTGPSTVAPDGTVVPNPDSLTRFANLLYIDPRQAGFSYDVIAGRAPTSDDCSQDVFSEYVDAADVLLATLQFLNAHSSLAGPVYWMGESYAGVRIQWILSYLRQAWELAPYRDPTLSSVLASSARDRLLTGQILLQPWLVGIAHASAIQDDCSSAALLAAVEASVGAPCPTPDACACANYFKRSPYNYTLSVIEQDARIFAADAAQVSPDDAQALYGSKLENIAGLKSDERSLGFKCSTADSETPDQSALVALLGALPAGQSYNLAYSPLTTGKGSINPDWRSQNLIGAAFLDNAQYVPALVTDGERDLVVPEPALSNALRSISGSTSVTESASELTLGLPNGARTIAIFHYPSAGHMITMIEPQAFAADLSGWLAQHP